MKRLLLTAAVGALLSGCVNATVSTGGTAAPDTNPLATLQTFTVTDLQAALADAQAHNDTVAATCYAALIPAVQSVPSLLPTATPKGGFSAFQAARDAVSGVQTTLPNGIRALNVPCAPLLVDATQTIVGIAAKVGITAAGASVGIPSLPIPILGATAPNASLGGR